MTRLFVALSASLALVIGAGAAYGFATYQAAREAGVVRDFEPDGSTGSGPDVPIGPCLRSACNYLLLGSDSRASLTPEQQEQFGSDEVIGGENRSDTIMLVHTDPNRERVVIVSFPRDLWVEIPGRGFGKINSAFEGGIEGGGPQLVARTIHRLTGLRISHFLYVDLGGFQGVVDTLGGVQMCIPTDVSDINAGLDLKAGCQTLDGSQSLAYVRTRNLPCDTVPDFARIGRQQQFLRALINRLLQPAELVRLPSLIGPILENMRRDEGLTPADLAYLVGQLRGITTGAADFRAVSGTGETVDGLSVIRMDPAAEDLFAALREGGPLPETGVDLAGTPPSEATIRVPVVEHGRDTAAAEVERILSEGGFDVSPGIVGYAAFGVDVPGSAIVYAPGGEVEAQVVARYFPDLRLVAVEDLGGSSVAIVVSPSYRPQPVGDEAPSPTDCIDASG